MQRRSDILRAALHEAAVGGYCHIAMREVAVRAGVGVGTLYHYFPSKDQLLVAALEQQLEYFDAAVERAALEPHCGSVALRQGVSHLIDLMERSEGVTAALTHAFVASLAQGSVEAETIRVQTRDLFGCLLSGRDRTVEGSMAADFLADVWICEVLALVQGRRTFEELRHRMATFIDLIRVEKILTPVHQPGILPSNQSSSP